VRILEKKILKIQKKTNKVFALFQKMINRLEKYNAKIEKMLAKSSSLLEEKRQELLELEAEVNSHLEHGFTTIDANIEQIKNLKKFIGKVDE
jgi:F0F1-type ATP synthase membrane subunit b/b'